MGRFTIQLIRSIRLPPDPLNFGDRGFVCPLFSIFNKPIRSFLRMDDKTVALIRRTPLSLEGQILDRLNHPALFRGESGEGPFRFDFSGFGFVWAGQRNRDRRAVGRELGPQKTSSSLAASRVRFEILQG